MSRNEFNSKEDSYLVQYIAKYCPDHRGRSGNTLYEKLVDNESGRWPWSRTHGALAWRNRYVKNKEEFDRRISKWQAKYLPKDDGAAPSSSIASGPPRTPARSQTSAGSRQSFTEQEDLHLVQYLAIERPDGKDRKGNAVYQTLVADPRHRKWSNTHPWNSWRERYAKRYEAFDAWILIYQKRYNIKHTREAQSELWNTLPEIRAADIAPLEPPSASHSGHANRPTARVPSQFNNNPKTSLKRTRAAISDTESEDEPRTTNRRSAVPAEEEDKDEYHKRRKTEKKTPSDARREEEEEETSVAVQRSSGVTCAARKKTHLPKAAPSRPPTGMAQPVNSFARAAQTGTSANATAGAEGILAEGSDIHRESLDQLSQPLLRPLVEEIPAETDTTAEADTQPTRATPRDNRAGDTHFQSKISQGPTPPTSDVSPLFSTFTKIASQEAQAFHPSGSPHSSSSHSASTRHAILSQPRDEINNDQSDFEVAAPIAQSSVPRRQGAKQPPMRIDGAFISAITGPNGPAKGGITDTSDSESDDELPRHVQAAAWPPKRDKGKGKATETPSTIAVKPLVGSSLSTRDAQGSSSAAVSKAAAHPDKTSPAPRFPSIMRAPVSRSAAGKPSKAISRDSLLPQTTPSAAAQPLAGPSRLSERDGNMERRYTLPTPSVHRAVGRSRLNPRQSMPAYVGSDNIRSVETRNIVDKLAIDGQVISADDLRCWIDEGKRNSLQRLVQSTGFSYETVELVWKTCGTIADTAAMLASMQANAEKGANDAYEALEIEEKTEERWLSVMQGHTPELSVSGLDASRSASRLASDADEYSTPDGSKAAILVKQQQKQEEADEVGIFEDERPEDEDEGDDDDSQVVQALRILERVNANGRR
ncbi:hypothetical protein BC835DRAFT_1396526 [Cytidiella melzeri]|nr:hypothetical protein BC835DRAFT_1396526 [Cytidiella melzeri]